MTSFEPPASVQAELEAMDERRAAAARAGFPWCDLHDEPMVETGDLFGCSKCSIEEAVEAAAAVDDDIPFAVEPAQPDALFGVSQDPQSGDVKITIPDPRDAAEGARRREEAISRVSDAAPAEWIVSAFEALRTVVKSGRATMTTDDIWTLLSQQGIEPPPERRAMAAVIRRAERAGLISKTDRFVPSELPWAHRRNTQVWTII